MTFLTAMNNFTASDYIMTIVDFIIRSIYGCMDVSWDDITCCVFGQFQQTGVHITIYQPTIMSIIV